MNILFLDWPCFCKADAVAALSVLGHSVHDFFHPDYMERSSAEFDAALDHALSVRNYNCIFSYNFFPLVSEGCKRNHINYLSVVYDAPHVALYSYTVIYPCNTIFLFDRAQYQELAAMGISTVHYLPLAGNPDRIDGMLAQPHDSARYSTDVSFVGSLYNEKHNMFDRITGLSDYARGYLDAVMRAQLNIYGYYFIEEALTDDILAELKKALPYDAGHTGIQSDAYIYGNYVIGRKLTELDRRKTLAFAASCHPLRLYTPDRTFRAPGIENMGPADYRNELPYIFHYSKINLNITLKSIKTGIPLRAIDIMSAGGFLLTSFQADFLDYFVPDEDFVYYNDLDDLGEKIRYYLSHDEERQRIAANGRKKIQTCCRFELLFSRMFEILDLQHS